MNKRQYKKSWKRSIIIYDLAALPKGSNIAVTIENLRTRGVLLYNSTGGKVPTIHPKINKEHFTFKDTAQ